MNDAGYWIGLACGALLGTVTTWLTIAIAITLGRLLARRNTLPWPVDENDTTDTWTSLDTDYQRLLETENGR